MPLPPGFEIDWNLVRTFVSVVENGSLSAAAKALDLAHPTVARHIQQLETQLGVVLFERCSTGLKINEDGQRLAEVAGRMRREAMSLESVTESLKGDTSGRVQITVAEVLGPVAPELLRACADMTAGGNRSIELIISPRQLNLLEREADIAVRHIRPVQSELVCRRVGSLPMGAWASADYVAEYGLPALGNLAEHWFVDGQSEQPFSTAVERLGHQIPGHRVAFRTDSLSAQIAAAESGWGIVGIPDYLGSRCDRLVPVLADAQNRVALEIWVVGRPAVRRQKLMRMVFDGLAEGLLERFGEPDNVDALRHTAA